MYPLFVVTKFDRLSLESLRRLEAPGGDPANWPDEVRSAVGARILSTYLPATASALGKNGPGAILHEPPRWFFSGLRTEEKNGETRIARRERPPLGGWEPDYPYAEYRSLLLRMGDIAHRLPEGLDA